MTLRKTARGTRPVSPYSADKFVVFHTPNSRRRYFVWIASISEASCMPQISAPKFKTEPTRVSNSLHFRDTGKSTSLKIANRLYKAKAECCAMDF